MMKETILVVDDTYENLFLLSELLIEEGYHVLSAKSGQLALELLENRIPDLILLDINMPKMNGFEVCKRVKQNKRLVNIPLIFLTAAIEIKEKLQGFRLGAVDYLTKPFHEEELKMRLKTHLSISSKEKELSKANKELKLAKEKAEESQLETKIISNQLESILDHLPGLVFYKDAKNNFIRVNKYFADAHNLSKQEFENTNAHDLYPKKDAQNYYRDDLEVITSGKSKLNIEEPWVTKEGERWVSTSKIPFIENNNIIGVIGISLDITEQKQIKQALEEQNKQLFISKEKAQLSENQFRNLFEYNPISLWEENLSIVKELVTKKQEEVENLKDYLNQNPDFVLSCAKKISIKNVNTVSLSLFKIQNKQQLIAHLANTFNEKSFETFKKVLLSVANNKNSFSEETEYIDSNGEIITAIIQIVSFNEFQNCIVSIIDITDRKNVEKQLHTQNDEYAALTEEYKAQNENLILSKEKIELSEYNLRERVKELKGIYSLGLLSEKYDKLDALFEEFVTKILPQSMQFTKKVYVLLKVNNKEFTNIPSFKLPLNLKTISAKIKVFNNESGELLVAYTEDLAFIKIFEQRLIDTYAARISYICERKLSERKLFQVMITAEERERSKLAKDLHDGLGPLLATSKLYSKALLKANNEKETSFIISKINEVIEESLQCSQEISNNLSPHVLHNFGLSIAIKSFAAKLSAFKEVAFDFNSNLEQRIDENIETSLYRISVELIHNSLKHAKAKNISIKIDFTSGVLYYFYSDNGKGFDIKSTSKVSEGMGLTNIKSRIKSINGIIDFYSEVGKGMQVTIVVKTKTLKQ